MLTLSKKVCLLGDFAVGKTSLVRRFVYDRFDEKYLSTIGVKVSRKTVAVADPGRQVVEVAMILWDLAGGEDFNHMRTTYIRGAAGAILVCDLTRPDTLASLHTYLADLQAVSPEAVCVLAANKVDLAEQALTPEQVTAFAAGIPAPCYFTSARTGENVQEMFRELAQLLVQNQGT